MKRVPLALLPLALSTAHAATPPAAPPSARPDLPTVIVMALPAQVEFVAWLPVEKAPDLVDLDLRVEVVLPRGCGGEKLLGLLRRGGPKIARLDEPDAYEVVIERSAIGECGKDAIRIGARQAIRFRLPDGQSRELQIGERTLKVARRGKAVTVDGGGPQGDVPGAPPTARPSTLVVGEVTGARLLSAGRVAEAPGLVSLRIEVAAKWPACAGPPLGLLGRGDASTHFARTRFEPLARAPFDEPCATRANRSAPVPVAVHLPEQAPEVTITVGETPLKVHRPTTAVGAATAAPAPVRGAKPEAKAAAHR